MQKTSLSFFKNAKVQLGCKDFFGRAYSFKHIKINFEKKICSKLYRVEIHNVP